MTGASPSISVRTVRLDTDIADSRIAKALAHPMRVRILEILDEGEGSPKEIAQRLREPLNTVSYHVGVLGDLGMIRLVKKTPRRGAIEHHYRAEPRRKLTKLQWADLPKTVRKGVMADAAARVTRTVEGIAGSGGFERPRSRLITTTLPLDAIGWREASDELAATERRLRKIAEDSRRRSKPSGDASKTIEAGVAIMFFDSNGDTASRRTQ
jgi:DNA-binding transcriptional ArsR family regulator